MKRTIAAAAALLVWLLAFCTLLSVFVEREMLPEIVSVRMNDGTVPSDCIFYDSEGEPHLYQLKIDDDTKTVREIVRSAYQIEGDKVVFALPIGGSYVWYSSKPPQDGDDVRMVSSQTISDVFLIVRSDGATETVEIPSAKSPFLQGQAKADLRARGVTISETDTVYSLSEVKEFYANLPKLAALGGILLTAILLWLCSFVLSKNAKRHKKILLLNAALMAAGLVVSAVLLHQIDLPSSLLPQSNIFDFAHYREEFTELSSVIMDESQIIAK